MSVQDVEMNSVSTNAVALNLNDFVASALQDVLFDTTILATKDVVLSLRMIGEVSAWNATQCDDCITNGGFPFPKLYVVRRPEPENKDASETEDGNEDDDHIDGIGDDDDDISNDEGEDDDDPKDETDANRDGGSEGEDENEDGDDSDEENEDANEDGDEEEEDEEVPRPPLKKRK